MYCLAGVLPGWCTAWCTAWLRTWGVDDVDAVGVVCEVVCTLGLGMSDAAGGHAVGNVELVGGLLLLGHRVELVSGTEVDSGTKVEFL